MARGVVHHEPLHPFQDPQTGRRVVRLTDLATHCHHCYFYHRPFTPDSRRMVYVSNRTGRRNLFLTSPDGQWVVGDECGAQSQSLIWVYELSSRTERPLCRHGSSCKARVNPDTGGFSTQDAHPHPLFAPDGRTVVFSSDTDTGPEGNCAIYLAAADGLFG
jgi:Tol biopolymer transport system component